MVAWRWLQSLGRNQSLARGLSIKNSGGNKELVSSQSILSGDVKSGAMDKFIKWFKTKGTRVDNQDVLASDAVVVALI